MGELLGLMDRRFLPCGVGSGAKGRYKVYYTRFVGRYAFRLSSAHFLELQNIHIAKYFL